MTKYSKYANILIGSADITAGGCPFGFVFYFSGGLKLIITLRVNIRRAIIMEYFAMMALLLVFATGYIIAVERSTYHDNKNNKK